MGITMQSSTTNAVTSTPTDAAPTDAVTSTPTKGVTSTLTNTGGSETKKTDKLRKVMIKYRELHNIKRNLRTTNAQLKSQLKRHQL